jgi:hypothetical protein
MISLVHLYNLQLNVEDLVAFPKVKHLKIKSCDKVFTPLFTQSFWKMIKSTTDLCVLKLSWTNLRLLQLNWNNHYGELVDAALKENGSIVDGGGEGSDFYAHFFKRNKENHDRTLNCVVHLLAIKRCRNFYNNVPKEMFQMLSMILWNTRSDVEAWSK